MNFGGIAAIVGIASTIIGCCVSLVIIGIKVGQILGKIDDLEKDNEKFGDNNREKFNKMDETDKQQSQTIALLKQSLDDLHDDVKEIKEALENINAYIREAERFRAGIESRVEYIERHNKE